MVPKALALIVLAFALPCQQTAGGAGSRRRVDARFTLAVWTLAFGPSAVRRWSRRTPVTIGFGRYRRSSLRRGMAREPLHQPIGATLDGRAGSSNRRTWRSNEATGRNLNGRE
jgi:hypothetical protein